MINFQIFASESLAITAVTEPVKSRTRASANVIREAYQQNLAKRPCSTATSQVILLQLLSIIDMPCYEFHFKQIAVNFQVPQPNVVNDSFDDEDLSLHIKIKWEGTSKIERVPFSTVR